MTLGTQSLKDYHASLDRWSQSWELEVIYTKLHLFWWKAEWIGPLEGKHEHYAFTRTGAELKVRREIAHWTRKRRQAQRNRQRRVVK